MSVKKKKGSASGSESLDQRTALNLSDLSAGDENQAPLHDDYEVLILENIALESKLNKNSKSLAIYRDLFEEAPAAYLIIDRKGKILRSNRQASKLFEVGDTGKDGHSIIHYLPELSRRHFNHLLDAAISSKQTQNTELIFVLPNHRSLISKVNLAAFQDEFTGQTLFRLIITDIADEKTHFSEQLKASESKYRELAENINEGIYLTESSYITMVNQPMLNIFGYTLNEVIGKKVWEFVVPEKRTEIRRLFIKKIEIHDASPVEIECVRKNGDRFWAEIKISIFKDQRKTFGVLSNINDRKAAESALKESEQKYRSVVTAMNDGIILRDKNGSVLTWNKAAERILELQPDEISDLLNIHPEWQAITEDGTPFTSDMHPAMVTLKTGKPQQRVVMGMRTNKGKMKWITINSEPVFRNGEKKPSSVVTSFSDITHQKNTEKKLRDINAIKDKLFGIIAHDLKSPFNAQMALLELLVEEGGSFSAEQRRHFVSMLQDSAQHSFSLLDNLLLWSRTQTGRIPFKPVELNLCKIVNEALKAYQLSASLKQIKLIAADTDANLKVKADHEMVNTVLRNLISNAIKFTAAGGSVTVSCKSLDSEQVQIAVSDTGAGIPEKTLKKLFTSQNIASTPGTENEKGTGLGLIICKEFVERNGGKIQAKSQNGKGSTFCFTLKNADLLQKCTGTCLQNIHEVYHEIARNDKLRDVFEQQVTELFHETFKSFDIERIESFSTMMKEIVDEYDLHPLRQFISNMSFDCIERDRNQANICFTTFEKLLEQIERERRLRQSWLSRK